MSEKGPSHSLESAMIPIHMYDERVGTHGALGFTIFPTRNSARRTGNISISFGKRHGRRA